MPSRFSAPQLLLRLAVASLGWGIAMSVVSGLIDDEGFRVSLGEAAGLAAMFFAGMTCYFLLVRRKRWRP